MTSAAKYSELGLVNTMGMFTKAMEDRYAIPAYNFNNMEQLQAIIMGCSESRSPVILQCSGSAVKYMNPKLLRFMVKGALEMMADLSCSVPVALHLDHGDTVELCRSCMDSGFSSVMIDGSHHSFEENIRLTKEVVDCAHELDVTVEHFKKTGTELNLKYIDPSYTIRSMPASPYDSAFCLMLGHNAVHAATAGRTDMVVGNWQRQITHVPIAMAVAARRKIEPEGRLWSNVLSCTGQPHPMA